MSNEKIKVELSFSQQYLPPGEPATVYIMLRLHQPKIDLEETRMPINTSFVLDRSGSMGGSKLQYTKQAVEFAISHLDPDDFASVVLFDDDVVLLAPHDKVTHKDSIIQLIQQVVSGGSTNLSGGLLKGMELVKDVAEENRVNRVILLTDGLANRGVTEPAKLVKMVKEINSQNISVSAMGVGEGFAEDLLVDMAEAGNGNFYFIASPDEIPGIFEQELAGLLSVTGQNLSLSITPSNNVEVTRFLGYPARMLDGALHVNLPDMYNGDTKTVLIETRVNPAELGKMPLADIGFNYTDVTGDLTTIKYDISAEMEVTDDPSCLESGPNLQVLKEVEIFRTSEVQEDAMQESDAGNYEKARQKINEQVEKLREIYKATNDKEVKEKMEKLRQDSERMSPEFYDKMTRKEMKMKSYESRKKR